MQHQKARRSVNVLAGNQEKPIMGAGPDRWPSAELTVAECEEKYRNTLEALMNFAAKASPAEYHELLSSAIAAHAAARAAWVACEVHRRVLIRKQAAPDIEGVLHTATGCLNSRT